MGVERTTLAAGNGTDSPKAGDKIAMQYTGWLYESNNGDSDFKGEQ
jgi:FK506-binding protein 1